MSETEHKTGKLKPCTMAGSVEDACKSILTGKGITDLSYYESYAEQLMDTFYKKYYVSDSAVYEVEAEEKDPYDDIFRATKNEDGSISFEVKYFNGGCSFNEAIGYALENI